MFRMPRAAGHWVADQRGEGRGVRVSAHTEAGFLVLSTWKADVCVATVRLLPDEAAELVAGVTAELASLAAPPVQPLAEDLEARLAHVEATLEELMRRDVSERANGG